MQKFVSWCRHATSTFPPRTDLIHQRFTRLLLERLRFAHLLGKVLLYLLEAGMLSVRIVGQPLAQDLDRTIQFLIKATVLHL